MENSDWTKEERARAAEQLQSNTWIPYEQLGPVVWLSTAIDLQCSLNRLQEQVREARELLSETLGQSGSYPMRRAWQKRKSEWLSRNK